MSAPISVDASAGDFGDWRELPDAVCRHCATVGKVRGRIWESHCGGYDDSHFECTACGGDWWVDGIDA